MKTNRENKHKREEKEFKKEQVKDNRPLPGDYPPSEDIMNRRQNKTERLEVDPNELSRSSSPSSSIRQDLEDSFPPAQSTKSDIRGPSDLTKEDYEALGPRDLSLDGGDDEQLKHRTWPVDFAARDIDIPGSELDDRSERIGSEDEENNSYSLGGDEKDNLEDDPTRTLG